jgi:uncharacterized protein (TIGR02391 family)
MLDLDASAVVALPVDELALAVLDDLLRSGGWSEYNYLVEAAQAPQFTSRDDAVRALAEALGWLRARGFIARTPGQSHDAAIFVTRAGRSAVDNDLTHVRALDRLHEGLHPAIERRARRQFLLGEFEQAVFVSMKAVEVRVRQLGAFPDDLVGVDLMNRAFGPTGPLTDSSAVKGEQEGTRALFTGAYAVLRNPSGHREVDYDDVAEAAEAVTVASLLMRVLDRVEARIGSA